MDKLVERYYELKQQQKAIEQELAELRSGILAICGQRETREAEAGGYRVKAIQQTRRDYDDGKLHEALPDPSIWRLLSKADPAKVAGLIKLNVLSEDAIRDTYSEKRITLLQVEKL